MTWDGTLARIAVAQHGLVTRQQAIDAGVPPAALRRRAARGALCAVHPGVFRVSGAPATFEAQLLAACLAAGPGAAASHRAAAVLWCPGTADLAPLEITVPASRGPRLQRVIVHRSRDLSAGHITSRMLVPVTSPLRTLVDLGAVSSPDDVEHVLDAMLAQRLVSVAGVRLTLGQLGRRGRHGAGVLRGVLDRRVLGDERPESVLEALMARLLRDHRLPAAVFQHEIHDDQGRFVARADFAYPELKVVIEVDGFSSRTDRGSFQRDRTRQNDLVELGWLVLRFTWSDVVARPDRVAARILRVLCTRTAA
ncbi:MAG: DUF559 domain-containing protein [Acidimicrobiales bacterium]|nr:DUF559 domain-containing protein [Acidimicrobiales bacterium]